MDAKNETNAAQDAAPAPVVKPGVQTSEFWLHVAQVVLGALAALAGTLLDLQAHGQLTITGAIIAAVGIVSSAASSLGYSFSRAQVKAAAQKAAPLLLLALVFASGCGATAAKKGVALAHEGRALLRHPEPGDADWEARRVTYLEHANAFIDENEKPAPAPAAPTAPASVAPVASGGTAAVASVSK